MRLFVLASAMLLVSSGASAGPCLPGTLQNYLALPFTGCTLGLALFNDFALAPGQNFATPIDPAQVQVVPGGTTITPSLEFIVNKTATAGQLFESFFHFDVSAADLRGATITLNNSSATGDGAAVASADICRNATFAGGAPVGCPTSPATLIAFATAASSGLSDSVAYTATSFFDVFVDLTIDGGLGGTARMGSATFQVVAVPEPSTIPLIAIGCGVLALGRFRRYF